MEKKGLCKCGEMDCWKNGRAGHYVPRPGQMTSRSRISIRWTTDPANMGYGGNPTDWKNGKPDTLTSPRLALSFPGKLAQKIGPGTYHLISYTHNGVEVSLAQLEDVVFASEYQREHRGTR